MCPQVPFSAKCPLTLRTGVDLCAASMLLLHVSVEGALTLEFLVALLALKLQQGDKVPTMQLYWILQNQPRNAHEIQA